MMDELLFETNPHNLVPVTDAELEEYISAREAVKRNYLKNKEEDKEDGKFV